ncbi:phage head closure protein [Kordiimonas pumila]|uniref:Phage head closure protein n=1 Tax=Kordiimonas pumila TaxID=2161677 RepID=A0ABV7D438_9PROT|nr:phage head closure protein [Kordiimonas pumila]
MTMLAGMRHRITLMQEQNVIGAGGRITKTTPIITDVWAEVTEGLAGGVERADKQIYPTSARFKVRYNAAYQAARVVVWRGVRYRIQGTERMLGTNPTLTFDTRLIEGETP